MKPVTAWAIGIYSGPRVIALVRYVYGSRCGEPCLYRSRESARADVEDPYFSKQVGVAMDSTYRARPVKVKVEVVE
jgi:hypothetical protein